MADPLDDKRLRKEAILRDLLVILRGLTSDWDMGFAGAMGAETRLAADLGFKSIQMAQFVAAIEERFQQRDLPFQELFIPNGRVVNDLRVLDVVDFIHAHGTDS